MAMMAPVADPVTNPMTSGEPSGLPVRFWNTAPDSARQAPTAKAATRRGTRMPHTTRDARPVPSPSNAPKISSGRNSMVPVVRAIHAPASRATTRTSATTTRRRVVRIDQRPARSASAPSMVGATPSGARARTAASGRVCVLTAGPSDGGAPAR